ncbi:hypothetical protein [Maribacter sp. 4G9]|uniref:hypothetical protein n=1 Tax=Maribacter sp. 4G9 TaxID=1889777 RepID=UPI000C1449B5|nr:hypothetical protein [Maribacter sp. 4G9]PIB39056.1 hypothetical protein BFP75_00850 [Maribacter sp. 4G9]
MAIANSCYIRNIQKSEQALLKKVGKKFSLNTTPSILMRVLKEFFNDQKTIEKQSRTILKLEQELSEAREELKDYKREVKVLFDIEDELSEQKNKLLQAI